MDKKSPQKLLTESGWWVGFGVSGKIKCGVLCRLVNWQNTSFNFVKRWQYFRFLVEVLSVYSVVLQWGITVSGLAKVAIFTTNVDAENQTLINHKCVCGTLNRHFCQTRVISMCVFQHDHQVSYFLVYCFNLFYSKFKFSLKFKTKFVVWVTKKYIINTRVN